MEKVLKDQKKLLGMPEDDLDRVAQFIGSQKTEDARASALQVVRTLSEPCMLEQLEEMSTSRKRALVRLEKAAYDAALAEPGML